MRLLHRPLVWLNFCSRVYTGLRRNELLKYGIVLNRCAAQHMCYSKIQNSIKVKLAVGHRFQNIKQQKKVFLLCLNLRKFLCKERTFRQLFISCQGCLLACFGIMFFTFGCKFQRLGRFPIEIKTEIRCLIIFCIITIPLSFSCARFQL